MIYDALDYLSYALLIAAFVQPNAPRFYACVIFISCNFFHSFFLSHYDGMLYYGSTAFINLVVILITSRINPLPKMVIMLHKICITSIVINFFGWVIWFLYYPPIIYNVTFVAIYAWTLITFINRSGDYVGGYTMDSWVACFRGHSNPSHSYFYKHGS
jgi:hypothetical protein